MRIVLFLVVFTVYVQGYGYLENPPGRLSAWKFGFKTPSNSKHMGLACGGVQVQYGSNGGKCGVCGDNYASDRPNEPGPGNEYATGTIVATYEEGDVVDIRISLTEYNKGYFEFRLCDNDVTQKGRDASIRVTQSCFDKHLLTNADGTYTKFLATGGHSTHKVKLPDGVQCTNCVLQWRYRAGDSFGCEGAHCGLGVGPQKELRGCADVVIRADEKLNTTTMAATTTLPNTSPAKTAQQTTTQAKTTTKLHSNSPKVITTQVPTTQDSITTRVLSTIIKSSTMTIKPGKIVSTTQKPTARDNTTSKIVATSPSSTTEVAKISKLLMNSTEVKTTRKSFTQSVSARIVSGTPIMSTKNTKTTSQENITPKSTTQESSSKIATTTPKLTTSKSTTLKLTTSKSTTPKPTTRKPTTPKPTTPRPTSLKPTTPKPTTPKPTTPKRTTSKPIVRKPKRKVCSGRGVWKHLSGWCNRSCNGRPVHCPSYQCFCRWV